LAQSLIAFLINNTKLPNATLQPILDMTAASIAAVEAATISGSAAQPAAPATPTVPVPPAAAPAAPPPLVVPNFIPPAQPAKP
jgi:hypothetical protein